jgi:flagella synthesis protein FlgN
VSWLRALANQAQQLNTTNGELIQSRMRYNQQALGVLFSSSKNASNLYGPDGQANMGSSGRHLGSG